VVFNRFGFIPRGLTDFLCFWSRFKIIDFSNR
jgi:hypothetical protein